MTDKKNIMSVIATKSGRVKELPIVDGQLIFVQDVGRIALDFNGVRKFYNQITELDTEIDRQALTSPAVGYYFVIGTATLWFYKEEWIQITGKPNKVVFVGTELPELGQEQTIYANITEGNEHISVWNEELQAYVIVADRTHAIISEDVIALFN